MTDADWLAAVAVAPDDPLVRLAYADWLGDRDDPRADLLRLDVELSTRAVATGDQLARLVVLSKGAPSDWRSVVCRVPTMQGGWFDFGYCDCAQPTAIAPELFGRTAEGRHVLSRAPRDIREVSLLCRVSLECAGAAIHYSGDDPVVERALGHDPDRCSRPWTQPPPPPPVPRVYGGYGMAPTTGPLVDPDPPTDRRVPHWIAIVLFALWLALPLSCCLSAPRAK